MPVYFWGDEALSTDGFSMQRLGGTCVVGVLMNGDGAVVMSRADMGTLPVSDATGLPYASTVPSVMHACGHDVHMTALPGAAKLMAETQRSWSGTFIVVFQPAEEVGGGARALVNDGLTHKVPRPDVVLGQHVMPLPGGDAGDGGRPGSVSGGLAEDYGARKGLARVYAAHVRRPSGFGGLHCDEAANHRLARDPAGGVRRHHGGRAERWKHGQYRPGSGDAPGQYPQLQRHGADPGTGGHRTHQRTSALCPMPLEPPTTTGSLAAVIPSYSWQTR